MSDTVTLTIFEKDGTTLVGSYESIDRAHDTAYVWAKVHESIAWEIGVEGKSVRILPFRPKKTPEVTTSTSDT